MNVIVGNAQQGLLSNLDIDIIKSISGVFTPKELVGMFRNFFFNKMVLDVTAIKDCGNINNYRELANGLDSDKVIYFIPENSPLCTTDFFSDLVAVGIYNFTTNIEGIKYLLRHSNTFNDVAQFQKTSRSNNNNYDNYNDYQNGVDYSGSANSAIFNNNVDNGYGYNNVPYGYNEPNNNGYNNVDNNVYGNSNNNGNYDDGYGYAISQSPLLAKMQQSIMPQSGRPARRDDANNRIVLGVKSVTTSAGASTLIYMMKQELAAKIGQGVLAVEVDKRDFKLFNDKAMQSVAKNELRSYLDKNAQAKVIIVDLNSFEAGESMCDDVIYLLESSIIKLNKLLQADSKILGKLRNKKVVLNRSLLSNKDISDFEYESGLKVFYTLPPLDERKHNEIILDFLSRLGLLNVGGRGAGKVFGLFRR